MKNIRLLLPFLLVFCKAIGQGNYSPMLDSLAWLTQTSDFTGTTYQWNYSMGDTIIGSDTYKKYNRAYLKEDTINRKVYKYDTINNVDLVLYDFALNIGDTFPLITLSNLQTVQTVCVLKDSVLTYAGFRDRWYLYFINFQQGVYIYESFGSITDPIAVYRPPNLDPVIYATCIYHNGIKTYGNLCPNYLTTFQFFLNPATCGECNGSASVFTTLNPVSISWTVPPYSGNSTIGLCPLSTGTVTVTQPPSQSVYSSFFMIPSASQALNQQINVIQASCANCCDGTISVSTISGVPPFIYSWQPSVSTTDSANGLCPGQYIITVTDSAGCTSFDTVTISFSTNLENLEYLTPPLEPYWLSFSYNQITVHTNGSDLKTLDVNVFDVSGRLITSLNNLSPNIPTTHTIQTPGIYLAEIRSKGQTLYKQKILLTL